MVARTPVKRPTVEPTPTPEFMTQFPWVGSKTVEQVLDLKKSHRATLRNRLAENVYWTRVGGKILWNQRLVWDWVMSGGDQTGDRHQRLLEAFSHWRALQASSNCPKN